MIGHSCDAFGAINLERLTTAYDPGSEDEIGISQRVIGVQMCHEEPCEVSSFQALDSKLFCRGLCLAHNTGTGVEEISFSIRNHRNARSGA